MRLDLSSASCNFLDTTNYFMILVYSTAGTDSISHLAGLCPDLNSECVGGTYTGYEQYIYAVTLTMPMTCSDWVASTHVHYRNVAITNLLNPGAKDLYVECHFSNANGLCDNSPLFTTIPLAYSCVNELFLYNHGGYDPDNDSLVYSLVNPLNAANDPIQYSSMAYSPTYPLTTVSGTFGFDPLTGQMSCIPKVIQIAVISVLVDEYRNGVKIGSVQRDLQIVVKTCDNNVPQIPDGILNMVGGFLVDSNTVQVCPGATLDFDLIGIDADVDDDLIMSTNLGITIPDATFTVKGNNPDTLHFHWQTTPGDTGFYVFTVTIKDDGCPISGQSVYSYTVQVGAPDVDAGPDLLVCITNPVVQLHVNGLSPYLWNNSQYLNNPNSVNPIATLPGLGSYEFIVTADVGGLCENYDTVRVTVTDDFSFVAFSIPDTVCAGDQVSLTATPSGGTGTFAYDWSSIPGGFSAHQASATDNPTSPIQYVIVVTSGGCIHSDTIPVFVRPLPSSNFSIDTLLCVGEETDASVLGGVIVTNNYDWNFGNAVIKSGTGSGPYQVSWDVSGTWPVDLTVTDQYGCSSNTVIDVKVNPNPVASFIASYDGCQPLIVQIVNNSTGAATYLWDFGDGTAGTDTVSTHSYPLEGSYTITLFATSEGCTSTSSATVTSYCDQVFFPGAFSPNGDGTNDFFHEIGALQVISLYYVVYNRWGELIYETSDQNASGWDGTYKGTKCDVGVYVWYAEATFLSGDQFKFKGDVTLVR